MGANGANNDITDTNMGLSQSVARFEIVIFVYNIDTLFYNCNLSF